MTVALAVHLRFDASSLLGSTRISIKDKEQHMGTSFAKFMATFTGRLLRGIVGLLLIAGGSRLGGAAGLTLALVGLLPLAAGLFNFCLIAPLIRAPFWGRETLISKR